MCKEGPRNCGPRPAPPQAKTYKRKNNSKTCGVGNYGYGRAPVLREPWRTAPKARHTLGSHGMDELKQYLEEQIRVVPQAGTPELPDLYVSPAELIRHILARQSALSGGHKAGAGMFVEVYGGVAQAVVSVDMGIEGWTQPTDFDARFYIARTGNDGWDFDRCRHFVEEYLLMKLQLASSADSELRHATPGTVRHRYYQKQVMIGGSFSLLSVGDPATGKAIDLEFATGTDGARKYFDDANSFVIPLSLQQLAGMSPAVAMSMTGSFEHAADLTARKELLVRQPSEVVNGLALYAHAVTTKQLTSATLEAEDACARELARSFMDTAHSLRARFDDPLRFLRSFLRSHYTARPLSALATVVQLCSELAAYQPELPPPAEGAEQRPGQMDLEWLVGELLADLVLATMEGAESCEASRKAVLELAAFARRPGPESHDEGRDVYIEAEGGRTVRLLSKAQACESARETCDLTAESLERRVTEATSGWQREFVQSVCEALRGALVELPGCEEEETHEQDELTEELEETNDCGLTGDGNEMYMEEGAQGRRQSASEKLQPHGRENVQDSAGLEEEVERWVGDDECRKEVAVVRREDDDDEEQQRIARRQPREGEEEAPGMRKVLACSCRWERFRAYAAGATEQAHPQQSLTAATMVLREAETLRRVPQLVRVQAG